MNSQAEQPNAAPPDASAEAPAEAAPGRRSGRNFLVTQFVFLVFVLIASIPEGLSPYNRVESGVQVAVIAGLWGLTDIAALAVRAIRLLVRRAAR